MSKDAKTAFWAGFWGKIGGWIAGLITLGIGLFLVFAWNTAVAWWNWFFFKTYELPVYVITGLILLIPFVFVVVLILTLLLDKNSGASDGAEQSIFTEIIEGFEIKFLLGEYGTPRILRIFCEACKCDITYTPEKDRIDMPTGNIFVVCENCKKHKLFGGSWGQFHDRMLREVDRRIRTGEWKPPVNVSSRDDQK